MPAVPGLLPLLAKLKLPLLFLCALFPGMLLTEKLMRYTSSCLSDPDRRGGRPQEGRATDSRETAAHGLPTGMCFPAPG